MVVDYLEGIIVAAINLKEGNKTLIVFTRIINKASFVEELSRSLFIKERRKSDSVLSNIIGIQCPLSSDFSTAVKTQETFFGKPNVTREKLSLCVYSAGYLNTTNTSIMFRFERNGM